ncbi:hypothetical protein DIPPA_05224 [Diplonema papillatum]|nr:hypothetical protein DIPPA_05224 [Diplonema papillatum]
MSTGTLDSLLAYNNSTEPRSSHQYCFPEALFFCRMPSTLSVEQPWPTVTKPTAFGISMMSSL